MYCVMALIIASCCVCVCVCVCIFCSEDIMVYVTVQVAPLCPGLPRPRFSLYLSSQLQYGVGIVYHRQCGFLLDEK